MGCVSTVDGTSTAENCPWVCVHGPFAGSADGVAVPLAGRPVATPTVTVALADAATTEAVAAPGVTLASAPAIVTLYFDPLGRPFDALNSASPQRTLTISGDGTQSFVIEPETGYVH